MPGFPHTLSIITTYRCTAACDDCCFKCNPQRQGQFSLDAAYRCLDEATKVPSIRVVVFTGGECFLLRQNLDKMVKRASQNGFATRFVSNGYWGKSAEAAKRRIARLACCGLRECNFSTGEMHAKYVKPAYVRNAAVACAEQGLTTLVAIELSRESTFDLEAFLSSEPFSTYVQENRVMVRVTPWVVNGDSESKMVSYSPKFISMVQAGQKRCDSILDSIGVTPDLDVGICCGLTFKRSPTLIGKSIRQLLATASSQPAR